MKEFKLEENEEVLANFSNVFVKASENSFKLNVILTNARIILLKDESELEIKLIIPLNEIKELKYIDNTNKITFKDNNNEIDIVCEDLKSFRIKLD